MIEIRRIRRISTCPTSRFAYSGRIRRRTGIPGRRERRIFCFARSANKRKARRCDLCGGAQGARERKKKHALSNRVQRCGRNASEQRSSAVGKYALCHSGATEAGNSVCDCFRQKPVRRLSDPGKYGLQSPVISYGGGADFAPLNAFGKM